MLPFMKVTVRQKLTRLHRALILLHFWGLFGPIESLQCITIPIVVSSCCINVHYINIYVPSVTVGKFSNSFVESDAGVPLTFVLL